MPLTDPITLFKENKEAFDNFLRSLSTLYSTGVLELLRERGRVRPISDSNPNYVEAQAARANWSMGYNQALDELMYFREIFLNTPVMAGSRAPIDFGATEKAIENGDLTLEEAEALRDGKPIPELKREPIPHTVYYSKPIPN